MLLWATLPRNAVRGSEAGSTKRYSKTRVPRSLLSNTIAKASPSDPAPTLPSITLLGFEIKNVAGEESRTSSLALYIGSKTPDSLVIAPRLRRNVFPVSEPSLSTKQCPTVLNAIFSATMTSSVPERTIHPC